MQELDWNGTHRHGLQRDVPIERYQKVSWVGYESEIGGVVSPSSHGVRNDGTSAL